MKKKENKETRKKSWQNHNLHLTVKIARRSNDNMTLVSETSHEQNHCGKHKVALNENLPTLCNDSSFAVQLSNLVLKTRHFAVYDKDNRNVWTPRKHATDDILLNIKWQSRQIN